jgi:uncharacterized protein (TIGR02680 family)
MPETPRFRPTRAGIVNLWDYGYEIFEFSEGRLVLRGANGSGKTKALELLFPFVLDASLVPQRLDPFSGEGRTMKQNVLYRGDRDTGHGYVWLELVRGEGDEREVRTIGAGLRAQRQRDGVTSWYFVTDLPIGGGADGVDVVDGDRRPLTLRQLRDRLGHDDVFEKAADYRERVDRELFGLGPDRYAALVHLVLFLRRPQLAKELDLATLSTILSDGLQPLDDDLVEQAARSFDDLESVQRELEQLERAHSATEQFLARYRAYLRVIARERVERVRAAERDRKDAQRRVNQAGRHVTEASEEAAAAERACADLQTAQATARAERDGLVRSDAYQEMRQLEDLANHVGQAERQVADLAGELQTAQEAAEEATAKRDQARRHHDEAARQRDRRLAEVAAASEPAGLAWSDPGPEATEADVRRQIGAAVAARKAEVGEVSDALDKAGTADGRVSGAESQVASAVDAAEAAAGRLAEASDEVVVARDDLSARLQVWAAAQPDGVVGADDLAALDSVVQQTEGRGLAAELAGRVAPRRDRHSSAIARADDRLQMIDAEAEVLEGRRQALLDEHDEEPPVPYTRGDDRDGRAGAPLWRLVDFAAGVDPEGQAALEAGLEAAGLLDAWVYPDARLPADASAGSPIDTVLTAGPPVDGPSLADVLVTSPGAGAQVPGHGQVAAAAVDAAAVDAVLASIALDDAVVAVQVDGRWRLGPLSGCWTKTHAGYIGATARAEHRRRRITELEAELATLAQVRSEVAAERERLAGALEALEEAARTLPSEADLAEALRHCERASGQVLQAEAAVDTARVDLERAQRLAAEAWLTVRRIAGERDLPADRDALAVVAGAVDSFGEAGGGLAQATAVLAERSTRLADLVSHADQQAAQAGKVRERHVSQERAAAALRTRYDTLQTALGEDARQIVEQVEALDTRVRELEEGLRAAQNTQVEAGGALARAELEAETAGERLEASQTALASEQGCLHVLWRADVRVVVGVEPSESPDHLLDVLDEVTSQVAIGDERHKAVTTAVFNGFQELERQLGPTYQPALDSDDDVVVVTVRDETGLRPLAPFAETLGRDFAEQRALLSERERQVFEDTLLDSLGRQLHERIVEAREQLVRMNASLRRRSTSSGLRVQLRWSLLDNASPEQAAAADLLERDPDLLDGAGRDQLRAHFSAEIQAARAVDPGKPYRELLARVLDYRSWRGFNLRLVHADGTEQQLTRKVFNTLSGGEKATALHLPLFAAAAAHYTSARADAPRLVALDEAFAGIDHDTQERLFGLTVEFDLDLFLTGHDLWPCYPAVTGLAMYDLIHLSEEHVVHAQGMFWDGNEVVMQEQP